MNKVYAVTYDLRAPSRDYKGLYEVLKSFPHWWHFLESTWLVVADSTPKQVHERLLPHLDANDIVLVIEVKNNKWGVLPQKAWEWIDANLPHQ